MKGIDGSQWLTVDTAKTDERCNIPLLPQAMQISNQKTNEFLKEIAGITGVKKKMHFHLARHTFATTICLNNGVSLEAVGKMLGQRNIRTTQIYAKMNDTRISNEMNFVDSVLTTTGVY